MLPNLSNCDECGQSFEDCQCYNSETYLEGISILEELRRSSTGD